MRGHSDTGHSDTGHSDTGHRGIRHWGIRHGGVRWGAGCGLLACALVAAVATGEPVAARTAGPPPSAGSVRQAAGQVSARAAELNAARVRLATDNARLASLQIQAEQVIEGYDRAVVDEHQAAAAAQLAQAHLVRAARVERASRRRVAALAAQDYEAGGGAGTMAAMLGNSGGPQAFLNGIDVQQQLAAEGTDLLSQNQATKLVAGVFQAQARRELAARRAAAQRAATLKRAILAALRRQRAAAAASQASTRRLEAELGAAQAHEYELAQAQANGLAADAAGRRQALRVQQTQAARPVTAAPAGPGGYAYGSWPSSYSLAQGASAAQGNTAADWALAQLGHPYQWGGAGPRSYDCSGLTMDAWAQAGVRLLHWTGYQWPSGPHIPLDQLRRGDLLFFATNPANPATIHHVGIYIGDGQMVDAPYTGADVRIDSIYQPGGLIGATRPAA
jgi:cell wall-associated NlpC family hydrolase